VTQRFAIKSMIAMAVDPKMENPYFFRAAPVLSRERQQREAQILQTGLFYSAARFRIIEGSAAPAEWLEVFETHDPDPSTLTRERPATRRPHRRSSPN
jgi:hypothetical protein